jgi:membrane protein
VEKLKKLFAAWSRDRCSRKAAALAYYTTFSLAPLIVIVVAIAGLFVSDEQVAQGVSEQARMLIGESGARLLTEMLRNSHAQGQAGAAAVAAFAVLLLGATTAFAELKSSLDDIWGFGDPSSRGWWNLVRSRLVSFGLVLSLAFLLLVSLLINAALEMFAGYFGAILGIGGTVALHAGSQIGSLLIIWLLFAAIYKLLPEVHLSWRDVAMSALITALLFSIGRIVIGTYLGNAASVSVYGAASSLAVLLLWVYYSSLIFLLGAEITRIWWKPAVLRRREAADLEETIPPEVIPEGDDAADAGTGASRPRRVPAPERATRRYGAPDLSHR